ncbi:D-alanine--poly(phosphoribitol) ligase subunit DltA [Liquorilactobacillus capillatus]|uniref:D-alanine--D-alanyl carrier protein ligase n=1 Tax=Liquorilactobacillus capillatus DSM 19910 TaxID=1423731 RepID=A0A0R1M4Q3_9LACO|nr:D-alanine--poly(phosphoribitol) ligase subunit DltA [Liquorilactobacillus capillatus]KRL03063.1 d-alanine--poly(phosphoribitol) ligase, subunit 1 [Liquorilactobacillus capillatus DSM 19910]
MKKSIIEKIDGYATVEPDRIAYECSGMVNTYQDLKEYSDALAAHITSMGLTKKTPIIVYGGQTFEMAAAFLGVVKSGHAYIPVDTNSPGERLTIINQIAQPAACIAVEELPLTLSEVPVIMPTELKTIFKNHVAGPTKENWVTGDETFYIIFTSGTTGVPKGVQISHDNLASFLDWMADDFGIDDGQNFLSQPPYSFDLSVMDLYPALTRGGKLVALPKEVTDNFKELFAVLPTLGLNTWVSTPSFMDICLLEPNFKEENYPQLTHFMFCGEELTHKTAATLKKRFPSARLFNTYGPTETTVAVSQVEITEQVLADYERLPIGIAKEDTVIHIVDEDLQDVPTGQDGEIIISGPSVSKGYLNNPEKTQQAFVVLNGQHAYRTGDLGQLDDVGQLLYKGRIDFQIKLHGFRIELEEVDHHLDQVSLIAQATTVPKYGPDHKVSQLIAYVAAKDNDFKSNFELTKAIKEELKDLMMPYMMPQRFVYLDSLPLTPNGKVDRKCLIKEVNG